jgi:hypothetical protein
MPIRMKCGDRTFTSEVQSRETFVSRSTGATLQRLSVFIHARTDQSKALADDIIRESRTIETLDEQGNPTGTWKPRLMQKSYSDNDPTHTYIWEITQEENVKIEALQLGDLMVAPYEYSEEFDDATGAMKIHARARLDSEQVKRLRSLPPFFSVVRKGINDAPREMRFGRLLWSDHGEYIKHKILLFDRDTRVEEKISGLFDPEMSHLEMGVAKTSCLMKNLLETLQSKGVLNEDAIQKIRQQADDDMEGRLLQFNEVDDLDRWA